MCVEERKRKADFSFVIAEVIGLQWTAGSDVLTIEGRREALTYLKRDYARPEASGVSKYDAPKERETLQGYRSESGKRRIYWKR